MINKVDITKFIINEIKENYNHLNEELLFLELNKNLCNGVLYSDPKFKESTIILTHIFRNLMMDFIKEVSMRINEEGPYKNE